MTQERAIAQGKVKKIRLEKFLNDENGNPIREGGPVEIWEGENEQDMVCIFKKEEES